MRTARPTRRASDNADAAAGKNTGGAAPDAVTITLILTPEQANTLIMAENTGTLRAALRNPGDQVIIPPQSETQFVSPNLIPPDVLPRTAGHVHEDAIRQATARKFGAHGVGDVKSDGEKS